VATDEDPAGLKDLAALEDDVRASARWLLGAFAAIGALLVPGLGIADIGGLDGWRWDVAIAAVSVAVLATIGTIAGFVRFLRPSRTSLAELAAREKGGGSDRLIARLEDNKLLLQGWADSIQELHERYNDARERLARAQDAASRDSTGAELERVAAAQSAVDSLGAVAAHVEALARLAGPGDLSLADVAAAELRDGSTGAERARLAFDYLNLHPELLGDEADSFSDLRTKLLAARRELVAAEAELAAAEAKAAAALQSSRTDPVDLAEARAATLEAPITQLQQVADYEDLQLAFAARRWWVALGALIVALAMAAFAVAVNEPPKERADLSGQTVERADLSGTNLEKADLTGTTFKDSNLTGADLDGAKFERTRFTGTSRCPDGSRAAVVGESCAGHREPPPIRPPVLGPTGSVTPTGAADGGS